MNIVLTPKLTSSEAHTASEQDKYPLKMPISEIYNHSRLILIYTLKPEERYNSTDYRKVGQNSEYKAYELLFGKSPGEQVNIFGGNAVLIDSNTPTHWIYKNRIWEHQDKPWEGTRHSDKMRNASSFILQCPPRDFIESMIPNNL